MATLRYIGETGQVSHNDVPLRKDQVLEVPDHEVAGYLSDGLFTETAAEPAAHEEEG